MKLLLRSLSVGIIGLLLVNSVIFAIALFNADKGTDWSAEFKHLTYSVNGEVVGFTFSSIGAYVIILLGAVGHYFKQMRKSN